MSYFKSIRFSDDTITKNAAGALRTAQLTTLFDGKLQNRSALDSENWDLQQSGATLTYPGGNKLKMAVATNGAYAVYQSNKFFPYFSGKTQIVEMTTIEFQNQTGKVKEFGAFFSSSIAPFDSGYDGFMLRSTASAYSIEIFNDGTSVESIPFANWDNYAIINAELDWSGFNVFFWEFLWLGGAALRLWVCLPGRGFTACHTYVHAGKGETDLIFKSPHLPVRYQIRSTTTDAGSFTAVCSQVATEGAIFTEGRNRAHFNVTPIAANNTGTYYALIGLRKKSSERNIPVEIIGISASLIPTTTDTGILLLLKNPTVTTPGLSSFSYSAALSGVCDVAVAVSNGASIPTVTALGTVIAVRPVSSSAGTDPGFDKNVLSWLTQTITDTFDSYVLAYLPTTSNQDVNGVITYKEF